MLHPAASSVRLLQYCPWLFEGVVRPQTLDMQRRMRQKEAAAACDSKDVMRTYYTRALTGDVAQRVYVYNILLWSYYLCNTFI